MNRKRKELLMVVLAAASVAVSARSQAAGSPEKPNVVFILADDLGWGDLACYGHPYIKTPNLDRLAGQGTLFTGFYVAAPTCSPSRAGFMTGLCPGRLGIHGGLQGTNAGNDRLGMAHYLDPEVPTITSLFQSAGYRTGNFGKWHLGMEGAPPLSAYGIDESALCGGNPPGAKLIQYAGRANLSEAIVNESIRFVEDNKDRPFYLNVWLIDPHAILNPTEEQMKPYEKFRPKGTPFHGAMQIYFSVITELDKQVGRLLKKLDDLNIADNTIVVFSSDNGPEFICQPDGQASHSGIGSAGPFRGNKHCLYEGGLRVPFIVRWPGHTPASWVDDSTVLSGMDFLPTLGALAGVKVPNDLDGEDMSKALLGRPQVRTKPLMWEAPYRGGWPHYNISPELAVRDGQWKLLMNPDGTHVELYNVVSDPTETGNMAKAMPEIVRRLSGQLLPWYGTLAHAPVDPGVAAAVKNIPAPYPWPKSKSPNK